MFDFRYHVVSLAAVFLALVLGILVGAAISDPGLADRADAQRLREEVARLQERLRSAQTRSDQDEAAQAFVEAAYAAVMEGRLADRGIAVIFVGSVDRELRGALRDAIDDADGGVLRLWSVRAPDAEPVEGVEDVSTAADLGRRLGEEFVAGGETPTWDAVASRMVEQRSGALADEADGVVVALRPDALRTRAAEDFAGALIEGLASSGVPVVGAERLGADPSAVPFFNRSDASVVDDADARIGAVSLAVLLAGGTPGHYGVKEGRDAAVPPVEPVVIETTTGD